MTESEDNRNSNVRRLLLKGAFASPIVASYAISALTIDRAAAATNTTTSKLKE